MTKKLYRVGLVGTLLSIIALFFVLQSSKSTIHEISSFTTVNFGAFKKGDLLLFDVDETLIQPVDAVLINQHNPKQKEFRQKLKEQYKLYDQKEADRRARLILEQARRKLIEPFIADEIRQMQQNNVDVIAFTGMNIGKKDTLLMEQWRYEQLRELGFEGSFANKIIYFDTVDKKTPVFYKGVLCTDMLEKGNVLATFLDKIELHPKKVAMFDDSRDYLLQVQQMCKERGIPFEGYWYKGAKDAVWQDELFEFQAAYLIKHDVWLDDKTAERMMLSDVYEALDED
jgi:hypothetical protein